MALYAQAPGQTGYTLVAINYGSASSGSFSYTATAGDGSYGFYTVATDNAGNIQATPAGAQATTVLDTAAPSSTAAPGTDSHDELQRLLHGDRGQRRACAGRAVRPGAGSDWLHKVATNSSAKAAGSFSYTATAGDGSYGFYTVATDNAGNVPATPATPQTTTLLDTTPPSSTGELAGATNQTNFTVSYTAADHGALGLAQVALYAQAPGQTGYTKVATNSSGSGSGSFSYTATAGDGSYGFYTIATDNAGNAQATPAGAQATTVLDTAAPSSTASSPALTNQTTFTVSYTAADNTGGSGLAQVALYAQAPGQTGYTLVAINYGSASSGSFSYTATAGDGSYGFYTVATDNAGNAQATPAGAQATTVLDTAAPSSTASSPSTSRTTSFNVSYTATAGSAGLAQVALYAQAPGQTGYTLVAINYGSASSGSFSYTATAGDGSYGFYTVATDNAGNVQATPSMPQTTTLLDTTAPSSTASSPALTNQTSFNVSYTATAGSAGLAQVALYVQAPGQTGYTKVATNSSGSGSGSFSYTATAGDGSYGFYTIATDNAGNIQATPAGRATTVLDTTAPSSTASSPALTNQTSFNVSYTAADNTGSAGLAQVALYAQAPGQTGYSKVATNSSGSGSGSFSYTATAGDGSYGFYTVATDNAGNISDPGGRAGHDRAEHRGAVVDGELPGAD